MDGFFHRHTKPGTAPGTLAGRAPIPDEALDFTLVEYTPDDVQVLHGVEVDECRFHLGTPGRTWIDVAGRPSSEMLRDLGMAFNLHPLALEDVFHANQRSKLDLYEGQAITFEDALRNADSVNDLRLAIKLRSKDAKSRDLTKGTTYALPQIPGVTRWRLNPLGAANRVGYRKHGWHTWKLLPGDAELFAPGRALTLWTPGGPRDYRGSLKADFADPAQIRFLGSYPASCGERVWPVAYADPKSYAARAVEGVWREMGGKLGGTVRDGKLPAALAGAAKPAFELASPQLAEVIRDINKYSNNVMAQQLFLTLSLPPRAATAAGNVAAGAAGNATLAASREVVQRWWRNTLADADAPVLDNGSGLSRSERISAQALVKLLQAAYASPFMPELMSSLPITGMDGTQRSNRSKARGAAHLKTGTLGNVAAIAGYVLAQSGRRYAVVMIVNQAGAGAARPAMDALLDWTVNDR